MLHVTPEGGSLRLRVSGFSPGADPRPVILRDALLPLDAIPVAANRDGPLPEGRCLRAPCSLAGLRLRPQDFLALAPKVADLDGDGLDEVVFVAVDGLREPHGPAHGMATFALGLAVPPDPGRVAAGFVRTSDEEATAEPDGRLSRAAVRQQIDVLGQTWLAGRFLPGAGQQLLLVALRVERGRASGACKARRKRGSPSSACWTSRPAPTPGIPARRGFAAPCSATTA